LLVMFFVTCDDFIPFGPAEEKVEYTDVEYSEDGSAVTLYLDGKGVPVTKAQRAITRDLAKMAYDYFEVIFIATSAPPGAIYARAQWELGQSAGISGVYRGTAATKGADYLWSSGKADLVALMFVGTKNDKTLLGVGRIGEVDHSASYAGGTDLPPGWLDSGYSTFVSGHDSDGLPKTPYAFIRPESTSVTFYVEAIKTGLLIGAEDEDTNDISAKTDSFNYTGPNDATDPDETSDWNSRITHSKRQPPASGSKALYPIYSLPEEKDDEQHAEYVFKGAAKTFIKEIITNGDVAIEKRFPRYLEGGRYRQLKENVDTDTTVVYDGTPPAVGDPIDNTVPLLFTVQGTGVFSFYIEMPVYMITKEKGTNNGDLKSIIWKLRTGLGSELYSLDTGKSSGGCVLMGIGEIDLDWLEIYWEWVE